MYTEGSKEKPGLKKKKISIKQIKFLYILVRVGRLSSNYFLVFFALLSELLTIP